MIEKHISSLLYRYQCVIVPGFGAFLTEINPVRFDERTNTFLPPHKVVSFNINIKHNDGLLAQHISQINQFDYEHAVSEIKLEVDRWNLELSNNNSISLNNLGSFELNLENLLVFTPINTSNFLTSSFGLNDIQAKTLERQAPEFTKVITLPSKRNSGLKLLRYAAILTVCIGLGSIVMEKELHSQYEKEQVSIQKSVQEKVQQEIQQATFFIDTPIDPITLTVKEKPEVQHPYHIIAGAFKSEENAQKATADLKGKGFTNATHLKKNKYGLYPVLYGSYTNLEQAQQAMKIIHKKTNPDAWILIQ